jgi:hypothetical protein
MGDPSGARVTGPLRRYAPGFVAELARLGYMADSASGQMFCRAGPLRACQRRQRGSGHRGRHRRPVRGDSRVHLGTAGHQGLHLTPQRPGPGRRDARYRIRLAPPRLRRPPHHQQVFRTQPAGAGQQWPRHSRHRDLLGTAAPTGWSLPLWHRLPRQRLIGRVFSDQGNGPDGQILAAMNWAIANRCRAVLFAGGSSGPRVCRCMRQSAAERWLRAV